MAQFDQGGGCSCGLYKVCVCNHPTIHCNRLEGDPVTDKKQETPEKPNDMLLWLTDHHVDRITREFHFTSEDAGDTHYYYETQHDKKWLKKKIHFSELKYLEEKRYVQFENYTHFPSVTTAGRKVIEDYERWVKKEQRDISEYKRLKAKFEGKL